MTGPDLAELLGDQETSSLEFKREPKDRNALREAICALANDLAGAGGGDLLIGVTNEGTPYPVDTSDEALLAISQLRDEGRILDRPSMTVESATFKGERVIRVRVNASGAPPVRFDGVAWVRPGPRTTRASADDERVLSERRQSATLPVDARPLAGARLADLDIELLRSTYVTAAVDPDVLEENGRPVTTQLASLKLLAPDTTPTTLGVLLGGYDPTSLIPGAYIQFVRYEGSTHDSAISDEEEVRDNLITSGRTLSSLLQAHVMTRVGETGALTEQSQPDYPVAALREVIMNAIVHRTYDGSNAPVRILWFSDRVEVSNPGGPYGIVNSTNFDRANDYRNPFLAAAMKSLGYMNRFGRGITRTREQMARNGNPPPDFEIGTSWWTVTLRSSR